MPRPIRTLVYATLLAGAFVFSFPFVWMASTSAKVDRELFTGRLQILPQRPLPRPQSPYYDARAVEAPDPDAPQAAILPLLDELARRARPGLADADARTVALELFASLRQRTPQRIWDDAGEPLRAFAVADLAPDRVDEAAQRVYRELGLGPVRARSVDLVDEELARDVAPASRWTNRTPEVASLADRVDRSLPYAAATYDFERGDSIVLDGRFDLPFDASELQRVQLRFRPDDTWHELRLTLEAGGRRYVARRPASLANFEWATLTWQFPSADDESTKIKTWILLDPASDSSGAIDEPRAVRMTLRVDRVSPRGAIAHKAALNYQRVADHIPFWRYVRVSIFLVVANIALTLVSSSLVAYAFARLNWPGREFCFLLMLATMMIPGQVTMIPHFLIWKQLGQYNTLTPLFAGAAFGSAFFIFLMRQFMKGIPRDLEDAARIDGCGFLRVYWHVVLPLVKPSLAAIAIFTFMGTWNDFLGPLVYIADQRLYSLAFGLYAFSVQVANNPALTMAASMLMTLPVIVVFFFAQKYFIQGITLTGMKG